MDAPDTLGSEGELASTNRVLLEATLLRSSLGIVQAVRQAQIPAEDNVLIIVDQFEELFRFRRSGRGGNSRDEAAAFFKLLLEATGQQDLPIYIALTMRSDFLGDCIEFQGLPEAVNDGLYLIPRMTRDELRSAITGPVAVAGGAIAQRLVLRLLNDLGDDQDQLPALQHALMRTWDRWESHRQDESRPLAVSRKPCRSTPKKRFRKHPWRARSASRSGFSRRLPILTQIPEAYAGPARSRNWPRFAKLRNRK